MSARRPKAQQRKARRMAARAAWVDVWLTRRHPRSTGRMLNPGPWGPTTPLYVHNPADEHRRFGRRQQA